MRRSVVLGVFAAFLVTECLTATTFAQEAKPRRGLLRELFRALVQPKPELDDLWNAMREIGVTRKGTKLFAFVSPATKLNGSLPQVLIVDEGHRTLKNEEVLDSFFDEKPFAFSMVATNVDGGPNVKGNGAGGDPTHGYPPKGESYNSPTDPEAQYVWRWVGMQAPDLVVEIVPGEVETWYVPDSELPPLKELAKHLPNVQTLPPGDDLTSQLVKVAPCETGVIPAVRVATNSWEPLKTLESALAKTKLPPSPARVELQKRAARSAKQIADQLLEVYGKDLATVAYIPALAVVGRLRQERIDGGPTTQPSADVWKMVEPYAGAAKASHDPKKPNGSGTAGHLLFGELAEVTRDERFTQLVVDVADLALDADGKPREAMPAHTEMSDAFFMGCPILAQAGKLAGDERYFDACLRHFRFMQKLCLRKDGIYRHSPLDEAAWGRGNGFPALGLAWTLDELPESYGGRAELLAAHRAHVKALLKHQDATGMWHQVIDRPESYREFTATAMITYAMMRGVRTGRLDRQTYASAIDKGWEALKLRIAADGSLVDVCTGTGKQKSLRDYYDRGAILGRDPRGGAMALMVVTERQLYEQVK